MNPLEQALPASAIVTLIVGVEDSEEGAAHLLTERWVGRLYPAPGFPVRARKERI
jgi:hypothetical protein